MSTIPIGDPRTGELIEATHVALEVEVQRLRDHISELQRTIARQSFELGELKRDKQHDAEQNRLWPLAVRWHKHHAKVTGRKSRWKLDVFERMEPFLKEYGIEVCEAASEGIAHDHFSTKRKNGTARHFNTLDTLLKNTDRFEEAINSCPLEVLQVLREEGLLPGQRKKKKGSAPAQRSIENEAQRAEQMAL